MFKEQGGQGSKEESPYFLLGEAFFSEIDVNQLSDLERKHASALVSFMGVAYVSFKKVVDRSPYTSDSLPYNMAKEVPLRYLDGFVEDHIARNTYELSEKVIERLYLFETAFVHLLEEDDTTGEFSTFLKENPKFQEAIGGRPDWLPEEE